MDRLSPGKRSSIGREFQALGPRNGVSKPADTIVFECLQEGTKSNHSVAAERSLDRPDIDGVTGTHSFDRYCGAVPFTQRNANTQSLYLIRADRVQLSEALDPHLDGDVVQSLPLENESST